MIRLTVFNDRSVAVFGLGGSGLAACKALVTGGASVIAWDDNDGARQKAGDLGLTVSDLRSVNWQSIDALVVAPGVPLTHPEPHWSVQLAQDAGVEVIGDVELFLRQRAITAPDAPFIAITGTNGKSTTTALTAHVLRALGCQVSIGGNIGTAILELDPPGVDRFHVIEMSSYQIDLTPSLAPTVGVLLNVSPDHLDRHGTLAHYADVKARLVESALRSCICIDDEHTRAIAERITPKERLYGFTKGRGASLVPRGYAIGSSVFVHSVSDGIGESQQIADLAQIPALRGAHNVENALATIMVLRALSDHLEIRQPALSEKLWRPSRIADGLKSFPGLAHRLQDIASRGRVTFVNDSKATNAESSEKALSSFAGDIFWIVGGRAKDGGIESLTPLLPRIAKAYLIGEAAQDFARTLEGRAPYDLSQTLESAVKNAAADARASRASAPVVLLSPACASFDQYPNFEKRGEHFCSLVAALPDVVMREEAL